MPPADSVAKLATPPANTICAAPAPLTTVKFARPLLAMSWLPPAPTVVALATPPLTVSKEPAPLTMVPSASPLVNTNC